MVLAELLTSMDLNTRIIVRDSWNHTAYDGTVNEFYGGRFIANKIITDRKEQMELGRKTVTKIELGLEKEMSEHKPTEEMIPQFEGVSFTVCPFINIYLY